MEKSHSRENAEQHDGKKSLAPEPEHRGSIWTHPYMIYVILTAVLFAFLLFAGWLALEQGWIPNRGIAPS